MFRLYSISQSVKMTNKRFCFLSETYDILCNVRGWRMHCSVSSVFEPQHDKTNKVTVRPAKTRISLGIWPAWSESSLSAWRKLGSLATHWAHSEDSDQTGRMPRLIWVFAGRTVTLLVLSWCGSFISSAYLFVFMFIKVVFCFVS